MKSLISAFHMKDSSKTELLYDRSKASKELSQFHRELQDCAWCSSIFEQRWYNALPPYILFYTTSSIYKFKRALYVPCIDIQPSLDFCRRDSMMSVQAQNSGSKKRRLTVVNSLMLMPFWLIFNKTICRPLVRNYSCSWKNILPDQCRKFSAYRLAWEGETQLLRHTVARAFWNI